MAFAYQLSRIRYVSRLLHDQALCELVVQQTWLTKLSCFCLLTLSAW
jgi:hypothetical protein